MCITLCWTLLKHSVKSFQRLFINTFLSSFDFELIIAERFHNIDVNLICSISGGSLFTVIYTKIHETFASPTLLLFDVMKTVSVQLSITREQKKKLRKPTWLQYFSFNIEHKQNICCWDYVPTLSHICIL